MCPGCESKLAFSVELAKRCAFTLDLVAPELPRYATPDGRSEMDHLRNLTLASAEFRYAARSPEVRRKAMAQIRYELEVIEELNFPGYFLIIYNLVDFCARENIMCQGRGSAANSDDQTHWKYRCSIHLEYGGKRFMGRSRSTPDDL